MPLTTAGLNTSVNAVTDDYGYVALFDGDPNTPANEISGGSPAYARIQKTGWTESNGVSTMPGTALFDIPSGATVTHFALMDAPTGVNMGGYGTCTNAGPYGSQGTYELTSATVTAT